MEYPDQRTLHDLETVDQRGSRNHEIDEHGHCVSVRIKKNETTIFGVYIYLDATDLSSLFSKYKICIGLNYKKI